MPEQWTRAKGPRMAPHAHAVKQKLQVACHGAGTRRSEMRGVADPFFCKDCRARCKVFRHVNGEEHTFDSFECAFSALAPVCENSGTRVIGHGIENEDRYFRSAHCAGQRRVSGAAENVWPDAAGSATGDTGGALLASARGAETMIDINVWTVAVAAAITAATTGLGALPFLFVGGVSRWWLGVSTAAAAGLMLAASHSLIAEGFQASPGRTIAGILLGLVLVVAANRLLTRHNDVDVAELGGADARKALLILGIMTAHSFAEGVGVGVSFGGSEALGVFIASAIAVHNIPEGLAISLVLVPRGTPVWKAGAWSIFTSLPQPLMAVPAYLFVLAFEPWLPVGLGLAAGAMIWMVFAELIPDALDRISGSAAGVAVVLAFVVLLAFQRYVLA